MSTIDNRTIVDADVEQHSLVKPIVLHLLPGVLMLVFFIPDGEQVILVGDVSPGSGNTPFLYLGDWLGWLSLAGWIFFVVFEVVENRRHKKAQEQEKADAAS